jgi:hypothetical protein
MSKQFLIPVATALTLSFVATMTTPSFADHIDNTPQLGWIKSSELACDPWTDDSQLCSVKREGMAVPVYSRPNGKVLSCFNGKTNNGDLQPIDEHNGYKLVTLFAGYDSRLILSVLDPPCQEAVYCENPSPSCEVFKLLERVTIEGKDDEEEKYYTPDLKRFLSKVTQDQWRDFDADPVMGGQELTGLKVTDVTTKTISDGVAVVKVTFFCEGCSNDKLSHIDYTMIRIQQRWLVADITYLDTDKVQSLRQIFKR